MSTLSVLSIVLVVAPAPDLTRCSGKDPEAQISALVNIDSAQAKRLVDFMLSSRRSIVMRPIGGGAPERRAEGSAPKPLAIKYKTCNSIDMEIGAPANCGALLVLFKPRRPAKLPADRTMRTKWEKRIAQREKEWSDAQKDPTVRWDGAVARLLDEKCLKAGKPASQCQAGIRTTDGYVRPSADRRPFTGDLDLFDIADSQGRQLPTGDRSKQVLIDAMIAENELDVLHGAHMDWDTTRVDDGADLAKIENIRQPILDVHRERPIASPTREPLVILRTDCTVCKTWAPPHPSDPKAAGLVNGDWAYSCIDGEPTAKSPRDASWPPKQTQPVVLQYKVGDRVWIRIRPSAPDAECFAVDIRKATVHKDGTGSYEFANLSGGLSGADSLGLERRACAGPPPPAQRKLLPVGQKLRIKPRSDSPESECFPITITKATAWEDGTGSYEYKNAGGGVSGDDADSLEIRACP